MKKMTRIEALDFVIENLTDTINMNGGEADPDFPKLNEVKSVLEGMRGQLRKEQGAPKKPTPRQQENAVLQNDILVALSAGGHLTVSELISSVPSLKGLTPQRVSALMRLLKLDNKVDKEVVKGKTLFFLI